MKNLTKSNFLTYLDAPMHLWAEVNDKFEKPLSTYDQHLIKQGYEVEKLAEEYLQGIVEQDDNLNLIWQRVFVDKNYEATSDALIHNLSDNTYDIYEIKSSSSVDKTNLYDGTFQFLVANKQIKINKVFILHLNKEYVSFGKIDLSQLFVAEDITDKINELRMEVDIKREEALEVVSNENSNNIQHCYAPKSCRCTSLCHDNLPLFSIYDIPHLSKKKKQELLDLGITQAQDIPTSFKLSYKQRLVADVAKTNEPYINKKSIKKELDRYSYPLYFLDYETFNSAVPLFSGYKPNQFMTFQYSIHVLESKESELKHYEHLSLDRSDPGKSLVEQLKKEIGNTGSVIVWNQTFEMGRNKEMAELYPEYSDFLLDLNERTIDLADIFKEKMFVHPQIKGSWSIKNVLPVLAPNLSYKNLSIGKGDDAMVAWWELVNNDPIDQKTKEALLEYCKLDTLAMVKIWENY